MGIRRSSSPRTARYARGEDYHVFMMGKLKDLVDEIHKRQPNAKAKLCVDTSPVLEKALAARAGIGWIGKNSILINEKFGSWFILGEIITDLEIEPDEPSVNRCGDCSACIDACPTTALIEPKVLDSRRCISYLTLEHRGPLPEEMKTFVSEGQYGCDVCQEVCPFNKKGVAGRS